MPAGSWERRSCGPGAKGERFYDWAQVAVTVPDEAPAAGVCHLLLIRRSITDPSELTFYLCHACDTSSRASTKASGGRCPPWLPARPSSP